MASINPDILPETIKSGIAPAMGHGANESYWAETIPETMSQNIAELIGNK